MNRIREIREAAGLTSDELGKAMEPPTSGATVRRLENGDMNLTVDWMTRIAKALSVTPADLLSTAVIAGFSDDVIEVTPNETFARALSLKGLKVYTVQSNSVADCGIPAGKTITVNTSENAIQSAKTGDILLVGLRDALKPDAERVVALRMFVAPKLLVTNRPRANVATRIDDPAIDVDLLGLVLTD